MPDRVRSALVGVGVLVCAAVFAGCDEDPARHEDERAVYSRHFDFNLADAVLSEDGFVESVQYDRFRIPYSIVDDGAVLLYYRDAGTWTALPTTIGLEAPDDPPRVDYTVTFGYGYEEDFLEVFLEASSNAEAVWDEIYQIFEGDIRMKAVFIDSFEAARKQGVDPSDYEEVKRFYDLEE